MYDIKRYKMKTILRKSGMCIYLSQLDLQRLYIRALRRAKLPIYYTQGFNPHPKMSYMNSLKVGLEGELEIVFHLVENISPDEFSSCLQKCFPDGLDIINAELI